ncbi:MAG: diacylglycerol kinase family protein [Bacteroidota bacterium]
MKKFSIFDRILSFKFAIKGVILLFKNEHNAWIHGMAMLLAVAAGFYFNISKMEWVAVVFCIGAVFTAEAFNTAIEKIADFIHPNQNKDIAQIKDLAAGGVLLTASAAFTVGLIIFLPKIILLIGG